MTWIVSRSRRPSSSAARSPGCTTSQTTGGVYRSGTVARLRTDAIVARSQLGDGQARGGRGEGEG